MLPVKHSGWLLKKGKLFPSLGGFDSVLFRISRWVWLTLTFQAHVTRDGRRGKYLNVSRCWKKLEFRWVWFSFFFLKSRWVCLNILIFLFLGGFDFHFLLKSRWVCLKFSFFVLGRFDFLFLFFGQVWVGLSQMLVIVSVSRWVWLFIIYVEFRWVWFSFFLSQVSVGLSQHFIFLILGGFDFLFWFSLKFGWVCLEFSLFFLFLGGFDFYFYVEFRWVWFIFLDISCYMRTTSSHILRRKLTPNRWVR